MWETPRFAFATITEIYYIMKKSTRLVQVSKTVAEEFMGRYEHLGNIGLGVWHWGLKRNNELISVVSYGTACFSVKRGWLVDIARKEGCSIVQLCRGGSSIGSPKGTASRIISLSNKTMSEIKGPLLVVAYADPNVCEIGTIYQSCNAFYTGLTNPKGQANYIINGKRLSGWQVRKLYGTRNRRKLLQIDPSCTIIPLHRKYRYVMVAASPNKKRQIMKLLKPYIQAYPKREEESILKMKI